MKNKPAWVAGEVSTSPSAEGRGSGMLRTAACVSRVGSDPGDAGREEVHPLCASPLTQIASLKRNSDDELTMSGFFL